MVWNESGTTVSKALLSAISNGSRPYGRHYSGLEQTPLCQKLQSGIKENELYRTSRTVRLGTVYSFWVKYSTGLMSKGTEERMYKPPSFEALCTVWTVRYRSFKPGATDGGNRKIGLGRGYR